MKEHVDEPEAREQFNRHMLKPNTKRQNKHKTEPKEHDCKIVSETLKDLHTEIPLDSKVGGRECGNLQSQ